MKPGFLVRSALSSFFALAALVLPGQLACGQEPSIAARYLGTLEKTAEGQNVRPEIIQATTATNVMVFNAAQIGVSVGSAQTLTATFSVSGYSGSFTPTADLHYGHDYSLGAVSCSGGGPETCTVAVTFRPTLAGDRRDAIFLMNGSARLATVLLSGVGQGPMSLVQPGAFTTSVPYTNYIYQSVADENGTVYILPSGGYHLIISVDKSGVVTQIPTSTSYYVWSISIDGAGVLYLFNESSVVETYDTVRGTQGTYPVPNPGKDTQWYPGTIGPGGTIDIVDQIANNGSIDMIGASGASTLFEVLKPGVLQPNTIAADSQGNVFVGGYEINKITPSGVQTQVNTIGASEGLAVDAADTVYATRYNPTDGVAELPASDYSTPIASFGRSSPLGLSLGSNGTLYVSNYVNLDIFDRSQTEAVNFGGVAAGTSKTSSTASVYNGGNQPLTISGFALSGGGFSLDPSASNECAPGTVLAPGALCEASAVFTPGHPGTFSGTIVVTSNSLNRVSTAQTIQLMGTSDGSYDVLSPTPLVFADQAPGTSKTLPVTMTNEGNFFASTIYSLATDNLAFTIAQGTCSGVAVAVGSSCQIQVTFKPSATQSYTGKATVVTYVAGTGQPSQTIILPLSGTGAIPPAATPVISPGTGSYSSSQLVTVTDATAGAKIYYTADGSNPSPASAVYSGAITVSSNKTLKAIATAAGLSQSATASATYTFVAPAVTLTPTSVAFGNQTVNTASGSQTVTLTNSGAAALTITSIGLTGADAGSFAQTNNCGASLAAGASCHISITFAPTTIASYTAAVAIADNASGSPHTVALSGSGTAAPAPIAMLTPGSLNFASIRIGTSSVAQVATLKNTGNAALTISSIAITGVNPADFAQTNSCGASLASGMSCAINVTFTPASIASFTAQLTVTNNAAGSPHKVALSGTGIALPPVFTISPTSLAFGNQIVNTTSLSKTVTLTNASTTDTVSISSLTSSDVAFYPTGSCPATINPGGTCLLAMVFNPGAVQSYSAIVTLKVDGISCFTCSYPKQTFTVTGTGIVHPPVMSVSPTTLDFGNQVLNSTSARKTVTLTNLSATDTVVEWSFDTGNPVFGSYLTGCIAPITPSASCTVAIDFKPTALQSYRATASFVMRQANCGGPCTATYPTQTFTITGTGIVQPPVIGVSPTTLDFGNQPVNTTSARKTVTLTNLSATDTVVEWSFDTGNSVFASYLSGCVAPIPPGGSCTARIAFTPTAVQSYRATASFLMRQANCGGSCTAIYPTQTFTITGTGIVQPPVMSISPTMLDFGNQPVNTTSARKTVTLTNTSATDTVVEWSFDTGNSVFGSYLGGCVAPIPPGGSCFVAIDFKPTALQSYIALASFLMKQANCGASCGVTYPVQSFIITGTGIVQPPVMSISPTTVDFGTQPVNTTSVRKSVTLTNLSATDTVVEWSFDTGNSVFASYLGGCVAPIPPGGSCTVGIAFTPTAVQSYRATASFLMRQANCGGSCTAIYPTQTFTITGTGIAPVAWLSPGSLTFSTTVGTTSATQTATLSNTGGSPLNLINISLGGVSPNDYRQTNNCPFQLGVGANCAISVTFSPVFAGSYPATLTVSDSDPTSPQTITLAGNSTTIPNFLISSPTVPQVILPGGSAHFSLSVTAENGATIPAVSLSATGLPPGATATFSQSAVTPGSTSATATLTIKTSAKSAAVTSSAWPLAAPVLALAGFLFIPARRRRYWAVFGVLTIGVLSTLTMLSGCIGSLNMLPLAKSYSVTVIGTVGTVQQTTTVQLIVQ